MPSSIFINDNNTVDLYKENFYNIFEYVRNFVDSPTLEFKMYLAIDSGIDVVDFRKFTVAEFNIIYNAILKALEAFKESGKSFRHDNRALKEWENIISKLEKDERFKPL